jgi:TolA-binding protein
LLLLSQEIERLNYVLKEHTYEIELLQKKESQYLLEIERLNNTLRLKVEETSRWEQTHNELKARLKSYEENLNFAGQEYDKLKGAHGALNEEHIKANKHLVEY